MKRIKKIMILLLLLIPFMVHAETIKKTYDTAVTRANNYIGGFQNKERYILSNSNIYGFTTSGVTNNSSFTNGGLLTSLKYQTSVSNNHSWLETGSEYWTQTQTSEGRAYIDAGIQYKGDDNTSGVRVTEFIIPDVRVRGTGSASNPWQFVEQYTVRISKNRNDSGLGLTVEKATVQSGEDDKITITETTGLMYTGEDDCGLTYSGSLSKYVKEYYLRDIQRDINCVANFDVRRVTVKYDCDGGTGAPADQRIVYGTAYTLAGKSCTKDGFIQTGWKAGSTNYALSASGTSWNVEEGEGGVSNGVLNLKAVYNDVQAPQ